MKASITLATIALLAATSAQAFPADAKKLAHFDVGFARCEQKFDFMRGHRDEAYLGMWKIKPDAKAKAQLASLRKGAVYKSESRVAQKTAEKTASPEIEARVAQQCQATWAEANVDAKASAKAASQPQSKAKQ